MRSDFFVSEKGRLFFLIRGPLRGGGSVRSAAGEGFEQQEDFLHDLDIKDRSHAEWGCKIENQKTVKARVDFGYLESQSKITEAEYQKLREENRSKYCVKAVSDGDKHEDRAEEVKPEEQKEAPKRRPEEPSARQTPITPDPHDFLE
jgi:hypothetical protein